MMLLLGKTELWVHRVPIFIPFMDIGNFINHIAYLPTLVFFFFFLSIYNSDEDKEQCG